MEGADRIAVFGNVVGEVIEQRRHRGGRAAS